jgi:hypothetical protein
MTIKLANSAWQHIFHNSIQPKKYGLEYAFGILYYRVIDKPLFFLSAIKHGLEFEQVEHNPKDALEWYTQINGSPVAFNSIIVCEDLLK